MTIRCSRRPDGDFHRVRVPIGELERRRRALVDLPWTMLDEHHGTAVVRVTAAGGRDGARGDVAITDVAGAVLGCWVADCAPIVLVGERRELAVVHAGWRGLASGIVDRAIDAFTEPVQHAVLGPAIAPCCYEFGADDLETVARGVHADADAISGVTTHGRLALDLAAAVDAALAPWDLTAERIAGCTGCAYDGFSHRVRTDAGRHVVAAWRPGDGAVA